MALTELSKTKGRATLLVKHGKVGSYEEFAATRPQDIQKLTDQECGDLRKHIDLKVSQKNKASTGYPQPTQAPSPQPAPGEPPTPSSVRGQEPTAAPSPEPPLTQDQLTKAMQECIDSGKCSTFNTMMERLSSVESAVNSIPSDVDNTLKSVADKLSNIQSGSTKSMDDLTRQMAIVRKNMRNLFKQQTAPEAQAAPAAPEAQAAPAAPEAQAAPAAPEAQAAPAAPEAQAAPAAPEAQAAPAAPEAQAAQDDPIVGLLKSISDKLDKLPASQEAPQGASSELAPEPAPEPDGRPTAHPEPADSGEQQVAKESNGGGIFRLNPRDDVRR